MNKREEEKQSKKKRTDSPAYVRVPLWLWTNNSLIDKALVQLQKLKFQNYHIERESYMHEVLNVDEMKNKLHILFVNCETNLMNLIRLWVDTKLLQ